MSIKFKTITGPDLMDMDLPPTRMVVRRLLPQGTHILAGAPKIGKSFLALWLCIQVSKGEPVWGLPTEKGTVLYLCLEDSLSRIQDRVLSLTDSIPPNIHFAIAAETLNGGLIKQIEAFIAEHHDTVLIVIDTLQLVRNTSGDINAYANDYKDISQFKTITNDRGIAILLVHHLRKQKDSDPFNMVSGTTGLTGAPDGTYILEKDSRNSRSAKLSATGRDIDRLEYIIEFGKDAPIWELISDNSDGSFSLSSDTILSGVIDFIKTEKEFVGTASELAEKMNSQTLPNILSKKIIRNITALEELGIIVERSRTGEKRELAIIYKPPAGDGNDSNDSKIGSDPVQDLPS